MWFLANLKLIGVIGAVLATFLAGCYVTRQIDNSRLKHALDEQQTLLQSQCNADKAVTKGANDALQKNLNTIAGKLAAAKRLHESMCVTPVTGMAEPTSGGREHAGQNGISTGWLRDFAAECETYRSEVIILNEFGASERKLKPN